MHTTLLHLNQQVLQRISMHTLVEELVVSSWTILDAGELSPHSSTAQTPELESIIVATVMTWESHAHVCCDANISHSFQLATPCMICYWYDLKQHAVGVHCFSVCVHDACM